ncbi:serine/threonine protein kinase [Clostridium botulinum]|uniref:serine/threonine protein kinase n=1 Tax=Clostridium TaxID=1485 RepID=UPI000507C560|nr:MULTISPECIES: serine/threonine protein kinase [unclassified Clostridium]AIY78817.1 hypothetical protein U728_579 [Clostridium botulinum 202F]KAI3344665.1 serine/threonine protein kinase [Clostridium botulinum]KFX55031.1 serine/threonine protein kinase [Clostridium botulinum]KFX56293.1 serine/threonine protein kinase [Clostridium botulinum]KON12030.1 serine/threonine protein kinase [Clostridium botulinum]
MRYLLNVKQCEFLGKGHEGKVYLTPEGFALKIFYNKKKAEKEVEILEKTKKSRFFPNVLFMAENMVLREFIDGDNLYEFLRKNGLTYSLSIEIIDLIEDFKILDFKRLNIRNAHIFVNKNNKIKVIDPRNPYSKFTPYPKDIIKTLVKLNLFDDFLKNLLDYKPDLLSYWIHGYDYFTLMSEKKLHCRCYAC